MSHVYFIYEKPFSHEKIDLPIQDLLEQNPMIFVDTFKIGESKNPIKRLKNLQTGNKRPLLIYRVIKCPNKIISKKIESMLHNKFQNTHKDGEWYGIDYQEINHLCLNFEIILNNNLPLEDYNKDPNEFFKDEIKTNFGIPFITI